MFVEANWQFQQNGSVIAETVGLAETDLAAARAGAAESESVPKAKAKAKDKKAKKSK